MAGHNPPSARGQPGQPAGTGGGESRGGGRESKAPRGELGGTPGETPSQPAPIYCEGGAARRAKWCVQVREFLCEIKSNDGVITATT